MPSLPRTFSAAKIRRDDDHAEDRKDGGTGAEARQVARISQEQVDYSWPTTDEAVELSHYAVDNHQGFRDPGGFDAAVNAARAQHYYGGVNDVFTLAAHLINAVQRQQALVEGNKRTATLLGLHFLEENGVETEGLDPVEFGDLIVSMAERTVTPEQVGEYLATRLGRPNLGFDVTSYLGREIPFERLAKFILQADWNDVMAKAKRLIQQSKVTILHNTPQSVISQVIGDGSDNDDKPDVHQVELAREDPESNVLTQTVCDCLLPGTLIVLADGTTKAVETIQVDDMVLDALGVARRVLHTMNRWHDGIIYGFVARGSTTPIWVTDNHRLLQPGHNLVRAWDWQENDFSYLPTPQFYEQAVLETSTYIDMADVERRRAYYHEKPIPTHWEITPGLAWVLGLYVAEGLLNGENEVRWTLGGHEDHLAARLIDTCDTLGVEARQHSRKRANNLNVGIYSRPLVRLFRVWFGSGARTKKIHQDIMSMPIESLRAFWQGWMEGDGCVHKDGRSTLVTASPDLAMQARLILARLDRESMIRERKDNVSSLVPGGGNIFHVTFRTSGDQPRDNRVSRFYADSIVYQRMLAPQIRHYSGIVYNLEVEVDHTYVVFPGIASANCAYNQFRWDRTGPWKGQEGRPCSHILATYWKSKSTPIDSESVPAGYQAPVGQKGPAVAPGQQKLPGMSQPVQPPTPDQFQQQSLPSTQQTVTPPQPTNPFNPPKQPGGGGGGQPKIPQRQQLDLFSVNPASAGPAGAPAGGVSVPGGAPPTPENPVSLPGTFSHVEDTGWFSESEDNMDDRQRLFEMQDNKAVG